MEEIDESQPQDVSSPKQRKNPRLENERKSRSRSRNRERRHSRKRDRKERSSRETRDRPRRSDNRDRDRNGNSQKKNVVDESQIPSLFSRQIINAVRRANWRKMRAVKRRLAKQMGRSDFEANWKREKPFLSGGNAIAVRRNNREKRMRMDNYRSSKQKVSASPQKKTLDKTVKKARKEASTRTKDTYWTKKLLEEEPSEPNKWAHSGFKEMYRCELGLKKSPSESKSRSKSRSRSRSKSPIRKKSRRSRDRKSDKKKKSMSPLLRKIKSEPRSLSPENRLKSPEPAHLKRGSPLRDRKKVRRSKTPKKSRRSRSRTPKKSRRSRSRTPKKSRRSKSRTPKKSRRSRSRTPQKSRKSRTPRKSRKSKSPKRSRKTYSSSSLTSVTSRSASRSYSRSYSRSDGSYSPDSRKRSRSPTRKSRKARSFSRSPIRKSKKLRSLSRSLSRRSRSFSSRSSRSVSSVSSASYITISPRSVSPPSPPNWNALVKDKLKKKGREISPRGSPLSKKKQISSLSKKLPVSSLRKRKKESIKLTKSDNAKMGKNSLKTNGKARSKSLEKSIKNHKTSDKPDKSTKNSKIAVKKIVKTSKISEKSKKLPKNSEKVDSHILAKKLQTELTENSHKEKTSKAKNINRSSVFSDYSPTRSPTPLDYEPELPPIIQNLPKTKPQEPKKIGAKVAKKMHQNSNKDSPKVKKILNQNSNKGSPKVDDFNKSTSKDRPIIAKSLHQNVEKDIPQNTEKAIKKSSKTLREKYASLQKENLQKTREQNSKTKTAKSKSKTKNYLNRPQPELATTITEKERTPPQELIPENISLQRRSPSPYFSRELKSPSPQLQVIETIHIKQDNIRGYETPEQIENNDFEKYIRSPDENFSFANKNGVMEGPKSPNCNFSDEHTISDSSSDEDTAGRVTLSARFGKLAQLSSQRQQYDGIKMKIVKDRGSQNKKVYLEGDHAAPPLSPSPTPKPPKMHEKWAKEHKKEHAEYQERYGEFRNWDPHRDLPSKLPLNWEDVKVRYRYYKESGFFGDRKISFDDYLKWEEWWYKYRDWLKDYGDIEDRQRVRTWSFGEPEGPRRVRTESFVEPDAPSRRVRDGSFVELEEPLIRVRDGSFVGLEKSRSFGKHGRRRRVETSSYEEEFSSRGLSSDRYIRVNEISKRKRSRRLRIK